MIKFKHTNEEGDVFVCYSTSQAEKERLGRLLSQTEAICRVVGERGKTGLWVVEKFIVKGQLVVIFSLYQRVVLAEDEKMEIRTRVAAALCGV
jgi:hypothetical protein